MSLCVQQCETKVYLTILSELGGCNIVDQGQNVTHNKHSWNSVANVLFLDRETAPSSLPCPRADADLTEPVGVGYSYADQGEVDNSPAAAEDVYAFLMLFISQVSRSQTERHDGS